MGPRISAVVNTRNEERNLPFALGTVRPWVDEIVVVDMHSEDRTVEIARSFGAKVFTHERSDVVEPARAYAIAQATGEWILLLDADEMVPVALSRRLREIARRDEADVVRIPRVNHLLGAPLGHTGWGPRQDRHERFFKPGLLHASDRIHASLTPDPSARILDLEYAPGRALVHFNYVDVGHFLEKLNRYTSVEALQSFERGGAEPTGRRTLMRATKEFLRRYVKLRGYRDGWRGFHLSLFMAYYHVATDAKLKELHAGGGRDAVLATYRAEAERILEEYGAAAP
ncbi:MAG TPA: glycosyltransferase family 2 protein [Longimicrobiales bacterium]